ncbi:MAG: hypothetical protein JRJ70_06800, partial [Deltaproteobacteria bacterium]|nr:hypothetical protein [Deltaproteobacteria bacterium]
WKEAFETIPEEIIKYEQNREPGSGNPDGFEEPESFESRKRRIEELDEEAKHHFEGITYPVLSEEERLARDREVDEILKRETFPVPTVPYDNRRHYWCWNGERLIRLLRELRKENFTLRDQAMLMALPEIKEHWPEYFPIFEKFAPEGWEERVEKINKWIKAYKEAISVDLVEDPPDSPPPVQAQARAQACAAKDPYYANELMTERPPRTLVDEKKWREYVRRYGYCDAVDLAETLYMDPRFGNNASRREPLTIAEEDEELIWRRMEEEANRMSEYE